LVPRSPRNDPSGLFELPIAQGRCDTATFMVNGGL